MIYAWSNVTNDSMPLVLALWVMALGYYCNKSGIWCLRTLRALTVRVGNKWSWFWPRVSIWYNSLLNVNTVSKYSGSDLFTNLYQNFIHWTSNTFLTFSISSSLNNIFSMGIVFTICHYVKSPLLQLEYPFPLKTPACNTKLQMR